MDLSPDFLNRFFTLSRLLISLIKTKGVFSCGIFLHEDKPVVINCTGPKRQLWSYPGRSDQKNPLQNEGYI